MSGMSRGPGPPGLTLLCLIAIFSSLLSLAAGEKNKMYDMNTLCKEYSLQPIYRKVDGALLKSQNEKSLSCIVTFQTHSILQRFLLRFDFLQLDCNDHLFIYDSSHAVGDHKHDLSCANTQTSVGAITTSTNFVTLKYVTDTWGTDSTGFRLVITAVKDYAHSCKDFVCQHSPYCISPDLQCDGVQHCKDGSDETSTMCSRNDPGAILGLSLPVLVIVSISTLLVLTACAVAAGMLYWTRPQRQQPVHSNTGQQLYAGANGTSLQLTKNNPISIPGRTVLRPMTVNWDHPAALGYLVAWVRLYCQAE